MYNVKEIFSTLQGEGTHAGRVAIFCRFTGCNLWSGREEDRSKAICQFCDTDFVGTDGSGGGKFQNAGDLAQNILNEWLTMNRSVNHRYVIFTGGEPLLQLDDDLIKAFELAKKQNRVAQFSKLYRALSELNEKRYRFKSTNQEIHGKLSNLFIDLQQNVLTPDKDKINFRGIQDALQRNKQENYALYATHRGVLGVIDTLLTILASLVVFYPITYLAQKSKNSVHAFFATDTEKKVNHALDAADEVINCIGSNLI